MLVYLSTVCISCSMLCVILMKMGVFLPIESFVYGNKSAFTLYVTQGSFYNPLYVFFPVFFLLLQVQVLHFMQYLRPTANKGRKSSSTPYVQLLEYYSINVQGFTQHYNRQAVLVATDGAISLLHKSLHN